jgi:hypothetical protein
LPAVTAHAPNFNWLSHTYTHSNLDCYTTTNGVCNFATLPQSLAELDQNIAVASTLGLGPTYDMAGLITPYNAGLDNPYLMQALQYRGISGVIYPFAPAGTNIGIVNPFQPYVLEIPRTPNNLFDDVNVPAIGVPGSWPDEYNSIYGPTGSSPTFSTNQTYAQILDNESDMMLRTSLLTYQPYPLEFHIANTSVYDGVHSLYSDLLDTVIQKYKQLYSIPVTSIQLRDIRPLLTDRASYDSSGVTAVYTPGVGVILDTVNAATIAVTGACSRPTCPYYAGQIQDRVSLKANSNISLSLTATSGVALSSVTLTAGSVTGGAQVDGLVTITEPAPSNGVYVSLTSTNSAVSVPGTVFIAAGNSSVTFLASTSKVFSSVTSAITASYNDLNRVTSLTVVPTPSVVSLSLSPSTVTSGTSSIATLTLDQPVTTAITVSLSRTKSVAQVPSKLIIPAGNSSATFTVTTSTVRVATTSRIRAHYKGTSAIADLAINP